MSLIFNTSYLNKTPNKTPRQSGLQRHWRIWHETGGAADNPKGTLDWNLNPIRESSYDLLIAWDGTAFQYIDWTKWTSWGAGVSSLVWHGERYTNWQNNLYGYNIEIGGLNVKGERHASDAQMDAAARFVLLTEQTDGIPLDGSSDFTHRQIAPGRKHDPEGYVIEDILRRARAMKTQGGAMPTPDYEALWKAKHVDIPYNATFGFPTTYRHEYDAGRPLGAALSQEFGDQVVWQVFEFAVLRLNKADGTIRVLR